MMNIKKRTNRTKMMKTRRSNTSIHQRSVLLLCLLFMTAISKVHAQTCACSPSTYEFMFDFSLTCNRPGPTYPPGIAEVTCFITSFSADVSDLVPVSVETISIIEADLQRVPIAQSAIEGNFVSGDSFTYNSVSALGNTSQIPQSIQLTITGTNQVNSSLVQVWAIKFTNECDVYPVLEAGETFGWTVFTVLGTPKSEVCPAAPTAMTPAPTAATPAPTVAETDPPTELPTAPTPEELPTASTPEPTIETARPTIAPTDPPTTYPTLRPTLDTSTKAPKTPSPTSKKGGGKDQTTEAPSIRPTPSPTRLPTEEEILTPTTMSFSYDLLEESEDFDLEWGRSSGKKDKKNKKDDSRKNRGRVRVGHTRRRRY